MRGSVPTARGDMDSQDGGGRIDPRLADSLLPTFHLQRLFSAPQLTSVSLFHLLQQPSLADLTPKFSKPLFLSKGPVLSGPHRAHSLFPGDPCSPVYPRTNRVSFDLEVRPNLNNEVSA
jgi:hypothetical protein